MLMSGLTLAALVAFAPAPTPASGFVVSPAAIAARHFDVDPVLVDWRILGGLDLNTGKAPPSLEALDGKVVKIAAFIVPLEDNMQESDEFLLVPYFGACVHTPPPPPNQMVYVKMKGGKTVKIGWWDPVMFEGVLHLRQTESVYGASYYEMEGLDSKPYVPAKK